MLNGEQNLECVTEVNRNRSATEALAEHAYYRNLHQCKYAFHLRLGPRDYSFLGDSGAPVHFTGEISNFSRKFSPCKISA